MRRRGILAILFGAVARGSETADFDDRVLSFNHAWNSFFRKHFGCPEFATETKECKPHMGTLAVKEFSKAAKEGRKLFAE